MRGSLPIELTCLARGISKVDRSSEWVWGITVDQPSGRRFGNSEDLLRFLKEMSEGRFQFNLPADSDGAFYKLPRDENAACDFLLHHGVFREQDLDVHADFPRHISEFWSDAEKKRSKPFALRLADFWDEQASFKKFVEMVGFLKAQQIGSADNVASDILSRILFGKADRKALDNLGLYRRHSGILSKSALLGPFSDHLEKAAVRLDLRGGLILPSIFTIYALPGLYAQIWKGILYRRPIAICARCGSPYAFTRPGKIHCTEACKNAAKQQRYRDRQMKSQTSRSKRGGEK